MGLKIWLNNGLVDQEDAKISVFDHGLLYGDGVFEGLRVYAGRIFELEAHLDRLWEGAKVIRLEVPMPRDKMVEALKATVAANSLADGYIRLVVTRGVGKLGLNPFVCTGGQVFMIATELQLYPEEMYENGLYVISASTIRNHPMALPPQVKSLNYLNNIYAKIEASDAGVPEAIMYNHLGYVAEASADNILIVKDGVLYLPPFQSGGLEGITAKVVVRLAREEGIEVVEKNLTRFDLYSSDEFFLTGTAAEVVGIVQIDGRVIGDGRPGPITKTLRRKFFEYVRS